MDPGASRLATDEADKAMTWLRKAIDAGWTNTGNVRRDSDLDFLRGRDDFKKLVADLETKYPPKAEPAPWPRERK
jgi:hypothetical protein